MADPTTPNVQIALPFSFGSNGGVVTSDALIKQVADHVYSAVGTQQGERVMDAAYGTAIMPFLFSSVDDITEQEITRTISQSLTDNTPEVNLIDVEYQLNPANASIDLTITYSLAAADASASTNTVSLAIG